MGANNYILLLANTYLENGEKIGYGKETTEIRKELFQQQLIRVQKIEERDNFVTKKEFLNHCLIASHLLKEYVDLQTYLQINRLNERKESTPKFWFDQNGIIQDIPVSVVEQNILMIQNEIDNFDFDEYLVPMGNLTNGIYKKMCNNDIEFLEETFENFNLETDQPQQPESEPLDLSDTSAVEKIIYLNELGIIDFLRTKPEFIGSTNLMASFLSAITDVKPSTLQTSLNRLINNDIDDKNHPYKTQKTVERIRQKLIDKNIKPKTS